MDVLSISPFFRFVLDHPGILVVSGIILGALIFFVITSFYIKTHYNHTEPVFIYEENGKMKKNHIASRFCKIVISNAIIEECLKSHDSFKPWVTIKEALVNCSESELHKPLTLATMHCIIRRETYGTENAKMIEEVNDILDEISSKVDTNLKESNINTPPYFSRKTYARWVDQAVRSVTKP